MKSEMMDKIVTIVAEVCEVPALEIRSTTKKGDVVEARCIFVQYCRAYGIAPAVIAKFLNRKRTISVYDHLRNYYIYRKQSFSFRNLCREVEAKLTDSYPRT